MPDSTAIDRLPSGFRVLTRSNAVKIAVWYTLSSAVWIFCSGRFLRHLVQDPVLRGYLEDAKGWAFVAATAFLLGWVLNRHFRAAQLSLRQIQEGEARLRLVGDNLPDSYVFQFTHDEAGRPCFTYISAGAERVHGVPVSEVLQDANRLLGLINPEQVPAYLAATAESQRNLTDFEIELRYKGPDSEERFLHVHSRPQRDASGRVHWDGFAKDITERKRAQEALQKSEALLRVSEAKWRSYVARAPVGVLVANAEGRHVEVNPCAEELLGYAPGELLGTRFTDLPAKENGAALQAHLDELATKGQATGQFLLRRKNGSLLWALIRANKLDGGGLLGVFQDITELKHAEAALRQSEANFRAMFEVASIGMAQADPHTGQWLRVNAKMCAITGYSAEELLRMRVPELTHPQDREHDWQCFQRVISGEVPDYHLEKRYLRKDGSITWVSVNVAVVRDSAGRAVRTMATIEDINERKRAEEALHLQSAALEAAANAIMISDRAGVVQWVNQAFTSITGYAREEIIGLNPRLLKSGKHDAAFYRQLWDTIQSGKVWHSEMVNRHKDGHFYPEEATITPVRDKDGVIGHFISVKQDITERKRAELELERTHEQLVALSRQAAVAEFATGILHNVGNVLNSVGVASSCLAESLKRSKSARLTQVVELMRQHESDLCSFFTNDPKGKLVPGYLAQLADKLTTEQTAALEEIAQMQKNLEHLKAIITVQQDSAKGTVRAEELNVADLVEDALKMHSNALARGEIHVCREFEPLPMVTLPKHRVLQILVNLIRNAIQACDGAAAERRELKIRLSRSADRLRCSVADTGIGIAPETMRRLFTFGYTTKEGGHGFGLHGALRNAQEMGGSLTAQSEGLHRGSTFTLELPLRSTEQSAG